MIIFQGSMLCLALFGLKVFIGLDIMMEAIRRLLPFDTLSMN